MAARAANVHFDVPQLVRCRPVMDCERATAGEEYLEAIFAVSTLLRFGQEATVKQLLFVIESPAGLLEVADYEPKTALTSAYVGHIERTQQRELSDTAGLAVSLSPSEILGANANAARTAKSNESVRFEALPPMQLLAASGTAGRGSAVYFKFKSTPQTTLDGSRPLRVIYRVPAGWRASYVYLRCVAFNDSGDDKNVGMGASHDFLVPLFRDGDQTARDAAAQLADREMVLRQLARQSLQQPERSHDDLWGMRLTGLFRSPRGEKRPLPASWLTTVLASAPEQQQFTFQPQLPRDLRQAVTEFTDARWQLIALNP
jgi:hypothetical protein